MAAEVKMEKIRPNIRIEIHNNLTENEQMEVDEVLQSDNEEGEIVEDDTLQNTDFPNPTPEVGNRVWPNTKGIFTTGINIFDKQEQEKLQERAKRFALKPEEIHSFTDADLEELHESLGINSENEYNVRFDAVHMIGTHEMSTEDVLDYFTQYAPTGIEWINDDSCNVIWLENISAARAIFYISRVVKGMPARGPCDPFAKEFMDDIEAPEIEGTGESILLKNKNREVELKVDDEMLPSKVSYKNAVDMSEITIPIPPGYWRLGKKHSKAKAILLRFALKTDKKAFKAEKFSKYYRKYGNPNYGGLRGVISESKKKEIRGIFSRNKELSQDKNPWGILAKNWDHDAKFREREPDIVEPKMEIKNPSILVRLGMKRKIDGASEEEEIIENVDENSGEKERKKNKLPRMRMYADDEEEKLRRKKLLQTIKRQAEKLSTDDNLNKTDLRNVLGVTNRRSTVEEVIEIEPEVEDLGMKLKNRTKNMVFTVERESGNMEMYDRKENVRSDIRSLIEERRARSPAVRRRISPPRTHRRSPDYRKRSPRRHRSPIRRSSARRRKSPERTLHSDRMYPRHRHRRRQNSDYYSEDEVTYNQKPRSKVAVVIKTQKKPTVASTIWSRVQRPSESSSESESASGSSLSEESSSNSSSEESDSDSENDSSSLRNIKRVDRPGFRRAHRKLAEPSPLKITMTNDRFKKEVE